MAEERVILVDENDQAVGTMEKLEAHRLGVLHRAISVFVFDSDKRLLLQQRAANKYHSAGLWTNTCCSHPAPDEMASAAAHRRLNEEMGLRVPLHFAFAFTYRAPFGNGLIEHELDHVFIGYSEAIPVPDPAEVAAYRWATYAEIDAAMQADPASYTAWFSIIYRDVFRRA